MGVGPTRWGLTTTTTTTTVTVPPEPEAVLYDFVQIECTGLKPLTRHCLYLDGTRQEADVQQESGALGGPLITLGDGKIRFKFFFNDVWYNKVDAVTLQNVYVSDGKGDRNRIKAGNYDQTNDEVSYALFELKIPGSSAYALLSLLQPNKAF